MKKAILINGPLAWSLKVDGLEIFFRGSEASAYFKKHYEELGYEVEIDETYWGATYEQ